MDKIAGILTFEFQLLVYSAALFACACTVTVLGIVNRNRIREKAYRLSLMLTHRESWIGLTNIGVTVPVIVTAVLLTAIPVICALNLVRLSSMRPSLKYATGAGYTITKYDQPLIIEFDSPVDLTKLTVNTYPKLIGTWKKSGYLELLPYGRFVAFHPSESYLPGDRIMVYLSNISKPWTGEFGSESLIEFDVPDLPEITATIPADGDTDVQTDSHIELSLNGSDSPANVWNFEVSPPVPFTLERKHNSSVIIRFPNPLSQATTHTVAVRRTAARYTIETGEPLFPGDGEPDISTFSFTTVKAPLVADFQPQGKDILPGTPVTIVFDGPMAPDSFGGKIAIAPTAETAVTWSENDSRLTLTTELTKDTAYNVVLKKGIRTVQGGELEQDLTYRFRTIGPVTVAGFNPQSGAGNVPTDTEITVTFDQDVVRSSAEEKFSVSPAVSGSFIWSGRTMTFKPETRFAYETAYTASLQAGIRSVNGLDSAQKFEMSFTTSPERFMLDVPMLKQESAFTCNIAATRMLLAYRGITKTENELVNDVGRNGSRGDGNPYLGYVSGYGTYWDPIVSAISKYRPHRLYKNWSLKPLLEEINKGNPVMTWGQNGWSDPHEISWTASDGTRVHAINGMHSVVVKGYVGPADNPTAIIINDPWRGPWTLPTAEFIRRWSYLKTALVID